jgi:hypothetical protein
VRNDDVNAFNPRIGTGAGPRKQGHFLYSPFLVYKIINSRETAARVEKDEKHLAGYLGAIMLSRRAA